MSAPPLPRRPSVRPSACPPQHAFSASLTASLTTRPPASPPARQPAVGARGFGEIFPRLINLGRIFSEPWVKDEPPRGKLNFAPAAPASMLSKNRGPKKQATPNIAAGGAGGEVKFRTGVIAPSKTMSIIASKPWSHPRTEQARHCAKLSFARG